MSTYTCPFHHIDLEKGQPCPQCLEDFANLPDPETMTGDERAEEIYHWDTTLTVPMDMMLARHNALVGRELFTHELRRSNNDAIANEARTRKHPQDIEDTVPLELRDKIVYFDESQDTLPSDN